MPKLTADQIEKQLPWPQPISHYDTDGPRDGAEFTINGALLKVSWTGAVGVDTLRDRFRVECLTCDTVIHSGTTSPSIRCTQHVLDKHNDEVT